MANKENGTAGKISAAELIKAFREKRESLIPELLAEETEHVAALARIRDDLKTLGYEAPKAPRTGADPVIEFVRSNPGLLAKEITKRMGNPGVRTVIKRLLDKGKIREGDEKRLYAVTEVASELVQSAEVQS